MNKTLDSRGSKRLNNFTDSNEQEETECLHDKCSKPVHKERLCRKHYKQQAKML